MPKRKKETPLTGKTKEGDILSEQEELFCNLYVLDFKRIEAVQEAYDLDMTKRGWRITASAMAYENLLKPHINRRIRELMDKHHWNDEFVDSETSFVIQQRADLKAKNTAIREYNLIKGRHAAEKHEHKFKDFSDEELRKSAADLITEIISDSGGAGKKK